MEEIKVLIDEILSENCPIEVICTDISPEYGLLTVIDMEFRLESWKSSVIVCPSRDTRDVIAYIIRKQLLDLILKAWFR